jgi:periplasmic copper chaperone A
LPGTKLTFAPARTLRRATVVAGGAVAAVLLLAVPALAHVTVTPDSAPAGAAAVLTFHVPNEEAHADATGLDMRIPTDHPIAQVLVKPVPGWKITVKDITLSKPIVTDDGRFTQAVSEVTWSGGRIPPGQFQDFTISADPLPTGVSELAFKAIQTYSNGDVVSWIDLPQPGQPAPDHPAPVLKLTAATNPDAATSPGSGSDATSPGSGSDAAARVLAIAGLVAGLLALAIAGLGWRGRTGGQGDPAGTPTWAGGGAGPKARGEPREDARLPAAPGSPARRQASAAPRDSPRAPQRRGKR